MLGVERVSVANEILSGGTERGLDVEGEGAQAPPACRGEERQLQDVLVQVHGDVCAQLVWEVVQQLQEPIKKAIIIERGK